MIDIIKKIRRLGVPTGSSVFGVSTSSKSDRDYIISPDVWNEHFADLVGCGINYNDGYSDDHLFCNYYIDYKGVIYDLIVPNEKTEFIVWVKTTEAFLNLPVDLIKDKNDRISLFEKMKDIYRRLGKEHAEN